MKNRNFSEVDYSFEQRNQSEKDFFSQGRWTELDRDMLGIDTLRVRLSKLLFKHVRQELPRLHEDLNRKYQQIDLSLNQLGSQRATEHQQRQYLSKVAAEFNKLAKAALDGHYEDSFFRQGDMDFGFEQFIEVHFRRLRAIIQYSNRNFTKRMHTSGHKYNFTGFSRLLDGDFDDHRPDDLWDEYPFKLTIVSSPIELPKEKALNWVKKVLIRTKGIELSGNFNPLVISELFWEQSEKWLALAQDHTEAISGLCKLFVADLLKETCPAAVHQRLHSTFVDKILNKRFEAAEEELKQIIGDMKGHPATSNHYYTDTVTKIRRNNDENSLRKAVESATTKTPIMTGTGKDNHVVGTAVAINTSKVIQEFQGKIEQDMGKHACQEALICVRAYYKESLLPSSLTPFPIPTSSPSQPNLQKPPPFIPRPDALRLASFLIVPLTTFSPVTNLIHKPTNSSSRHPSKPSSTISIHK